MNIKYEKIDDMIYSLTIENGANNVNAILLAGKKDSILIDTAYENRADELKKAVESISPLPVRYIINTHHHFDHTGANRLFDCPIISHEKARDRIAGKYYHMPPYLTDGVPDLTISESKAIQLDDETLELRAMPPAHTDGDLLIYLRDSRTLILGDLLFSETLPFIDLNNGGHIEGEMQVYREIPHQYPDCLKIIAGHGRNMTMDEFVTYGKTVESSVDFIGQSYENGLSREDILAAEAYGKLKDQIRDGEKFAEMWVDIVIDSLCAKESISRPLSKILIEEGIERAVDFYKEKHNDKVYKSEERDINLLAYNLMFRGRNDEAQRFFELYAEIWPESANSWDSLGEYHLNSGDREKGRRFYEKALEMDPERVYIKEILDSIGS